MANVSENVSWLWLQKTVKQVCLVHVSICCKCLHQHGIVWRQRILCFRVATEAVIKQIAANKANTCHKETDLGCGVSKKQATLL